MILSALILATAFVTFLVGMQLSAFFSGSETGFYRVSQLQLALQRQQGDRASRRLCHFVDHPDQFVSTTLVGNNAANYLTTLAIGIFVAHLTGPLDGGGMLEVAATLLLTPVVFIFGELIPKSLYYRAPLSLLRKRSALFQVFYYLFLPLSFPLTLLASTMSRVSRQTRPRIDLVFGRMRLFGLLEVGKREGIITRIQGQLADNLMHTFGRSLRVLMEPVQAAVHVPRQAGREKVVRTARRRGVGWVFIEPDDGSQHWTSCVRVAALLVSHQSVMQVSERVLSFDVEMPPLTVLGELYREHASIGIVLDAGKVVGFVRRSRLAERLLLRPGARGARTAWEM